MQLSPRFTQLYFVTIDVPGFDAGQMEVATHSLSMPHSSHDGLEHSITFEGAANHQGYVQCYRLPISMRQHARRWWIDVPRRCLPRGWARISVRSQTTKPPTALALRPYSVDRLVIPGRHRLHGLVRPHRS